MKALILAGFISLPGWCSTGRPRGLWQRRIRENLFANS
jgi:hypothetical protein